MSSNNCKIDYLVKWLQDLPGTMLLDGEPLEEALNGWRDLSYNSALVRYENDEPAEIIAIDGGEPEDQTLTRDYGWVAEAMQAAYELGRQHGN